MQSRKPILGRAAVALVLAGVAGLLLNSMGETLGDVVVNSAIFGAAVFFCGSVVVGKNALLRISVALIALMGFFALIGYAVTLAIDGVGSWTTAWFMDVVCAVVVILSPAVLTRLNLRAVT